MSHERLKPEYLFDEEKIKQLKQIAPECFEDGKINFETLRQNLGQWVIDEDEEIEHFGLSWPGKKDARRLASIPSQGTLEPIYGEGLKSDGTPDTDGKNDSKNIFIEGENLEVLKILQKSYAGKIKMIYIDPPYNTGNDFVYDDDFTEPLQEYLRRTGQVDEEGKPLTTNKRADGRFHSKWLSMIYPRLRLARNLLCEEGIIFVSIDDNEVHNLRAVLNEVFGEENFLAQFVWKRRQNPDSRNQNMVSPDHEYVLSFSKTDLFKFKGKPIDISKYTNPDNDPRGPWASIDLSGLANSAQRPNLHYDIIDPKTGFHYPPNPKRGWSKSKANIEKMIEEGRILFPSKPTGRPREKKFLQDVKNDFTGFSTWLDSKDVGYTTNGTREVAEIFEGKKIFDFPKPKDLIKKLIEQSTTEGDTILDFFAGSGTTAHACLELNDLEKVKRNFITVQFPEEVDQNSDAIGFGLDNLSKISKERIKRSSNLLSENASLDIGYRSFKLTQTAFKNWEIQSSGRLDSLEKSLDLFNQSPLVENWSKEGLLTEVTLIEGFTLSSSFEKLLEFSKNKIIQVTDDYCEHSLLVCLDEKIHSETIEQLKLSGQDIFICLDSAISNVEKLRLSDKGLIKTI
ncbi:site-specific DNA-methyltransferase [Algoriphagus formosus]|uniref:site-specific DNA-methyltransferase n=1 Tax=Algoriphagus formosus TaxID=2007308 RepID=UPI000C28A4CE|nr:site-specific DNA-methyltransferase [Algoriphagus formosus]